MSELNAVNLAEKLGLFSDHWAPKVIGALNEYELKLVKVQGQFVWHAHPDTDELFLVLSGQLEIAMRDRTVTVCEGELFVVPKGVEHQPRAHQECHILLMEPRGVVNTGDTGGSMTAPNDVWI